TYALPARHPCARDTAPCHRGALLFHHLVQGPLRHAAVADPRLHLPADELPLVHRGATVVRRRVDAVADRWSRHRAHDRHLPRRRPAKAEVVVLTRVIPREFTGTVTK